VAKKGGGTGGNVHVEETKGKIVMKRNTGIIRDQVT
jgi:hypothetical protein